MPNYNYQKGVRKERKIVNEARERGLIAFRSAGSHSPIDVCIINKFRHNIRFIQCKPDNMPENAKNRLQQAQNELFGDYAVTFEVF